MQPNSLLWCQTKVTKYCRRGYFRWGKISRKCWQDISRGGNFHDSTHIFFINAYGFYFRVGVIFAKKTKSRKTRKLPPCEYFHVYSNRIDGEPTCTQPSRPPWCLTCWLVVVSLRRPSLSPTRTARRGYTCGNHWIPSLSPGFCRSREEVSLFIGWKAFNAFFKMHKYDLTYWQTWPVYYQKVSVSPISSRNIYLLLKYSANF